MGRRHEMTAEEAALKAAGILMSVGACGCCESPWVKMEIAGEVIIDADKASFDMFEERP